jgi:hypothetical protein
MDKKDDFEKLFEYVDAYLALHEEYARKLEMSIDELLEARAGEMSIDELLEARAEWQSNRGM